MKNITAPLGWFYSEKFNYWQKTKGKVVVYVSRLIFGYQAQLYYRGQLGFCELEVRTNSKGEAGYLKMFVLAEIWLEKYQDGDSEKISKDIYHISNPNGVWLENHNDKKYLI